mmetsp:Transcript_6154/g.9596  ORF Transcript_6154/g.9596 Transcript_6154/m.9596 type:complete len:204 (-) Transcript_6154:90-701(-)|eukprot:CAMPEP_0178756396 /NCGR_PEP_ID=MMETSP0744-20121128/13251_1 /TAXON_ID=913974 /ORGANISM="Nitzschia punctata, Strain CCMP561" /LENGTH=203 /DNA_ID=CAMNT_0020410533 /DNA_START=273 /DNA_END=884 /DNA_ORIENTATION=-
MTGTDTTAPPTVEPSKVLPLRMTSIVVRGYGRGSRDLGIPTANLDRNVGKFSLESSSFDDLPTGIYWGFCRIGDGTSGSTGDKDQKIFKTACSIGYNPYYHNTKKTVEPHLIADPQDTRRHLSSCGESVLSDFYDQPIRLSLLGYLRPELPFEGLEKLIAAIKQDIADAERLGDGQDASIEQEKAWVASDEEPTSPMMTTHSG